MLPLGSQGSFEGEQALAVPASELKQPNKFGRSTQVRQNLSGEVVAQRVEEARDILLNGARAALGKLPLQLCQGRGD